MAQEKNSPVAAGQKITPFLWFNDNVEEAMNFYLSVFKNAKITGTRRRANGKILTATFELEGQKFMAVDGGPHFSFTPAISMFVNCESQEEVDTLWSKLLDGGKESQCGWLQDKFGLSWQIIPKQLGELLGDPDPVKSQRAMQAMLQMVKIDVAALQRAAEGK